MLNNILAEAAKMQLTKKDLAKLLGVSEPTLRGWVRGKPIPSTKLVKMADMFNCSTDYILEDYNREV